MDGYRRITKTQSFHFTPKSFTKIWSLRAFLVLALIGCQTPPKSIQITATQPPPNEAPALGKQLTWIGNNESPSFSYEGQSLLFSSSKRDRHTNSQIYELSLVTHKEKRITFQDGDCSTPIYFPNIQKIIYASTTDELKERPALLYTSTRKTALPPAELYSSDPMGNEILRLTTQQGYQGQQSWLEPQKSTLLFLSHVGSQMMIMKADPPYQKPQALLVRDKIIVGVAGSNTVLTWIERAENSEEMQIATKRKDKVEFLDLPVARYQGLSWLDAKEEVLLFSSDLQSSGKMQIYAYELKTKCLIQVVQHKTSLLDPQVSTDKKSIAFTALMDNGSRQLFLKELSPTEVTCPGTKTP